MRRLFVLELNEVPLRILQWYAETNPGSATARLLAQSATGESLADEPLPRDLYPSQSWASLASGTPFDDHGVFWYGDPKPAHYPLYWQAAAQAQVSTGVVGTLHSSPLSVQCDYESVVFALPDAFASDAEALPARLEPLQRFSLDLVQSNSRVVTDTSPIRKYVRGLAALARVGVAPAAAKQLGALALQVGSGRVPKERLRVGQFHLMADQFTRLARQRDPQLSVLFSNHVASAMHRYWPASFPDDWDEAVYDAEWQRRYEDEIPASMRALDLWLEKWMDWCVHTGRTLLLLSSMGQRAGSEVDTTQTHAVVVDNPDQFGRALGFESSFETGPAMVPQVSFRFSDAQSAQLNQELVSTGAARDVGIHVDRRLDTLTVTYDGLQITDDKIQMGDIAIPIQKAGVSVHPVTEHRSAVHCPVGSIVVFNSDTASLPAEPVDYLTIAPAILAMLGVEALPHHREPGFTI